MFNGGSYSLCQKKRTFNSKFFCGPSGRGEPKIQMADYVKVELPFTYSTMWIFGPPPPGGPRKNSELNVRFF